MATTGLTAEEAQAALPGQNINKVCHVYVSKTGAANVLYDLPEETKSVAADDEPAPAVPKKAKREKKTGIEAD